jgi:hypothetical protein
VKAASALVPSALAGRVGAVTAGTCVVLAAFALIAGCGGIKAPDLFLVTRTPASPGGSVAQLTLLVNEEGGVHCNGVAAGKLDDPQLLKARDLQEDLHDPSAAHLSLPPRPQSVFRYHVRDESGSVSFSDNSARQPAVLRGLALFVLQTAQTVCHLPQ